MNRLFAALLAILLLALPIAAFAEGAETPPAETQAPVTTPNPTPEPTPQPTPVVEQLIIDSWSLYDGMDKTYQQGYVPRIVNGCCYIIFPLIGETYDGKVTVTADLGATADSPFVFGNYSPVGILVACLLFGGVSSLQYQLQATASTIPYQIWVMLPYVFAVAALCMYRVRSKAPACSGIPYVRD